MMKKANKISAVIINYNGFQYVKDLVSSLEGQSYPIDEILVIDDCSTDDSFEKIKKKISGVSVFQTSSNSGPGVARDLGITLAKNKKILLLDNDVELERNAVKYLIEASLAYSEHVFFVARALYFEKQDVIQKDGTDIHYLGITINSASHKKRKEEISKDSVELKSFPGVCYLIDLEKTRSLEKHDSSFFYTFEDLDFAFRNYLKGNKAILIPNAEAYHKAGTKGLSYRDGEVYPVRKLFYLIRNRWFFILKNYSWKSIILLLPLNILLEPLLLLFSLFRTRGNLVYFRSHLSLLKNLKGILKKRKNVIDIRDHIENKSLRINEATLGYGIMKLVFKIVDGFLVFYGKYILRLRI